MVVVIVLLVLVVALLATCVKIVPQANAFVIERLGAYQQTWPVGLHFKVPLFDRVAKRVTLKEQVVDFAPQPVITKDNVTMRIDTVVFYQITDPKLFTYGVENPIMAIENLTATTLRNIIGEMELDQTLTSREIINTKMRSSLDEATDPWGIKVTRVELKNILPPDEIRHAMEKEMKAERDRRQTILEAEGHKQAVITRAEGDKQAKLLAAEAERDAQIALAQGRAQSIKLVYEAEAQGLRMLSAADPTEQVIKLKGLEALKNVADGRATKIYMPSDIAGAISTIGVIGESLGIGDHIPVDTSERPAAQIKEDPCIKPETGEGGIDAYAATEAINIDVETDRFKGIAGYDYQAAPEQ